MCFKPVTGPEGLKTIEFLRRWRRGLEPGRTNLAVKGGSLEKGVFGRSPGPKSRNIGISKLLIVGLPNQDGRDKKAEQGLHKGCTGLHRIAQVLQMAPKIGYSQTT